MEEQLFRSAEIIDCGIIEMVPVLEDFSMDEAVVLKFNLSNSSDIIKVFPNMADASKSLEDAAFLILKFTQMYELRNRYSMYIKYKGQDDNSTIGMIWMDSPETPLGVGEYWILDFFITKELRNYGIMSICVENLMKYSRFSGIKNVRAVVTDDNKASKRVLYKNGFRFNPHVSSSTVEVFDIAL